MKTRYFELTDYKRSGVLSAGDIEKLKEAAEILRQGGLCAFPTETVYGLGGNGLDPEASGKIYAAKGRPSDNPLILHISCLDELKPLVSELPEAALQLAQAYWPGPMTLVLNKSELVPKTTTGGLETVAVRMPSHPAAAKLIELTGLPIAAPSANRSGRPSTTTAEHCREDLDGLVDAVIDGGSCEIGLESSIIDLSGAEPVLLRPGAITAEMLEAALGKRPAMDAALLGPLAEGVRPKAPGMKYRHYAPKAPMLVVRGEQAAGKLLELAQAHAAQGEKVCIICSRECAEALQERGAILLERGAKLPESEAAPQERGGVEGLRVRCIGSRTEEQSLARELFAAIREADSLQADYILAEGFPEDSLGLAIMNRMKKAAGWQVLEA